MTTFEDNELAGIELRYVLAITLVEHGRTMTVDELARSVAHQGFVLRGRPGKVISDALRWEVRKGRVIRDGRDRSRPGTMPRSTRSRLRRRVLDRRRSLHHHNRSIAA